jgi:vesicle transport protein SEC22
MASTDATPDMLKNQGRAITKKLHLKSPSRMSIESGPVTFHYIIEDGVVFLSMADASYPRKLVFSFLAEVYRQFVDELKHEFGDR